MGELRDRHRQAFDIILNSKIPIGKDLNKQKQWDCNIKRQIHININKLIGVLLYKTPKDIVVDYHEIKRDIHMELKTIYYAHEYDKKYNPLRADLLTYVKIFINSHVKGLLRKELKNRDMSYNNEEYDDQIFYAGKNNDLETDYITKERDDLFQEYAKEHDRINEWKIYIGEKYYSDFVEKGSKEYFALAKRIERLIKNFQEYYDKL